MRKVKNDTATVQAIIPIPYSVSKIGREKPASATDIVKCKCGGNIYIDRELDLRCDTCNKRAARIKGRSR